MKKIISLFLTLILLCSIIIFGVSCAQTTVASGSKEEVATSSIEKSETRTEESQSGSSREIIELTVWAGNWQEPKIAELTSQFGEENPNIKIKYEYFPWETMLDTYTVALRNDAGPHVMDHVIYWTALFQKMGKFLPIDDLVAADNYDMSIYFEAPVDGLTFDGQIYGLPYQYETQSLIYNKTLFEEAGLDPEDPPETWPELLEYAKKLTKGDVYGFGLVGDEFVNSTDQVFTLILCNGGEILNEDNTKCLLNEPAAVEAVQFWVDMLLVDKVAPKSSLENNNTVNMELFYNEKVAMIMQGNYAIPTILEHNPGINMATVLAPEWVDRKYVLGGWNMSMTNAVKDEETKRAAWEYMKFIASNDISPTYTNSLPAIKTATGHEKYSDPLLKSFVDSLSYCVAMPKVAEMTEIRQIIFDNLQYALLGDKTVEECLDIIVEEVDLLLK